MNDFIHITAKTNKIIKNTITVIGKYNYITSKPWLIVSDMVTVRLLWVASSKN